MKRHKRDMNQRAYQRGFYAGLGGKAMAACPHTVVDQREQWLAGWREGREANWSAMTGVSGLAKVNSVNTAS